MAISESGTLSFPNIIYASNNKTIECEQQK